MCIRDRPPARYTEATLIKALEENGIGRPSTYAPIITTIIDRGYVEREQKKLKPTLLGRAVDGLMLEQFPHIVDVDFSAEMEKNLDTVSYTHLDVYKRQILHVYDFLRSLPDYDKKLDEFLAPWQEENGFAATCWHDLLLAEAARSARAAGELFRAALADCPGDREQELADAEEDVYKRQGQRKGEGRTYSPCSRYPL